MYPLIKGTVTRQAHVALPKGTCEEEFGRQGFYGPASHLYHTHPPTGWTRIEGPLKPRAYEAAALEPEDLADPAGMPLEFAGNADVTLSISRRSKPMPYFFRQADGDLIYFVHRGRGMLETDFGPMDYRTGDYLVIPRGATFRLVPAVADQCFYIITSAAPIRQPERGILGQHALYDPAAVATPSPKPAGRRQAVNTTGAADEWEVRIQREGALTSVFYPFDPLDVVGWKGDLSVWRLNVDDIRPVMSHRAHLAPSVHTTFVGRNFVVCTFVPRPLEEDPEAVRVPFYHRNIDFDEVIFYHEGEFFSRHGIGRGMVTLHPGGIHHGPHPKALQESRSKTRTNEVAVMVDTANPLHVARAAAAVEWPDYHLSWREPGTAKPARGR